MKPLKKVVQCGAFETRAWELQIYDFLRNFRATPQQTTKISPAELMFNRKMKTTLPRIRSQCQQQTIIADEVESHQKIRNRNMKNYYDKKHQVKPLNFMAGEEVLMKQIQISKTDPKFNPEILIVKKIKGNMVTAES